MDQGATGTPPTDGHQHGVEDELEGSRRFKGEFSGPELTPSG
jgi:hypothetical protein